MTYRTLLFINSTTINDTSLNFQPETDVETNLDSLYLDSPTRTFEQILFSSNQLTLGRSLNEPTQFRFRHDVTADHNHPGPFHLFPLKRQEQPKEMRSGH